MEGKIQAQRDDDRDQNRRKYSSNGSVSYCFSVKCTSTVNNTCCHRICATRYLRLSVMLCAVSVCRKVSLVF